MTIGIYSITHIASGKRYIGKSTSVGKRLSQHRCNLKKVSPSKKMVNRYLHRAVQKYGIDAFRFEVLEEFTTVNDDVIAARELHWMDVFQSTDRSFGYNLRRDSSTKMIVHPETIAAQKIAQTGCSNNNYGFRWTDEMKNRMSAIKKKQHSDGVIYNDEWRAKQGVTTARFWKENPDAKDQMAVRVGLKKRKYKFHKCNENGEILQTWLTLDDLLTDNPDYKWQNIYAVCSGHKKRMYGFKWKKELL